MFDLIENPAAGFHDAPKMFSTYPAPVGLRLSVLHGADRIAATMDANRTIRLNMVSQAYKPLNFGG